ncbi:hypothetical protein, partial [Shigella sp. FC1882]|uniref:hypothetical protein n=1 Tax=Shigella sp. FC1882 TaxID=1886515 RepID=UPI001C0A6FE9
PHQLPAHHLFSVFPLFPVAREYRSRARVTRASVLPFAFKPHQLPAHHLFSVFPLFPVAREYRSRARVTRASV